MIIKWKKKEDGFYIGLIGGKQVCKITEHWTGCWLDGFKLPTLCENIDEAKIMADKLFRQTTMNPEP